MIAVSSPPPFIARMIALLVGCIIMATSGSLFSFSVFSDSLRSRFQMTSSDVNIINAVGNTAVYLSYLVIGPIYDAFGDKITSALGLITYGLGYMLMWAAFQGYIPATNASTLSVFYFLAGFGSSCGYIAAIGVNLANFTSKYSGVISGILLLFYGLSGTIYAQIYATLFSSKDDSQKVDTAGFLLFMALSVIAANGLGVVLLFKSPPASSVAPVMIDDPLMNEETVNNKEIDSQRNKNPQKEDENVKPTTHNEVNLSPLEILKSPIFWIYANATVWQQGLTYTSNVTTILRAVVGASMDESWIVKTGATHVTLLSVGQTVSRFGFAVISDILQGQFGLDRSALLILANIFGLVPMIILGISPGALESQGLFIFCSLFVGLSWGASGALFPLLTKELFGTKRYGTAMGFVLAGCPISFFVSNLIFGGVYDTALNEQIASGGTSTQCYGFSCFQRAFLITMFIQILPVALSVILFLMRMKLTRYLAVPTRN